MVPQDLEIFRVATIQNLSVAIQRNAALVQSLSTGFTVSSVRSDMYINQVEMSAVLTLTSISAGLPIGTTINLTCESLRLVGLASGANSVGDNAEAIGLQVLPEAIAVFTKYNTQLNNAVYAPNGVKFIDMTLVAQNNDAGTNGSLVGDVQITIVVSGYRKKNYI